MTSEVIETDFYLTLDADVICIKHVLYGDLIIDGKALTTIEEECHTEWYKNAERVLGLQRSGLSHGVTPSILNKHAIFELQKYLSQKINPINRFLSFFLPNNSIFRQVLVSWRSFLIRKVPWTEYSLYNTFLEGKNLFENYHIRGGRHTIYDGSESVWDKEKWINWDLERVLRRGSFFLVIQSNIEVPPHMIWDKVGRHLNG